MSWRVCNGCGETWTEADEYEECPYCGSDDHEAHDPEDYMGDAPIGGMGHRIDYGPKLDEARRLK